MAKNHTFLFLASVGSRASFLNMNHSHPVGAICVASPNTSYGPEQNRLLLLRFDPQRISLSNLHRKQGSGVIQWAVVTLSPWFLTQEQVPVKESFPLPGHAVCSRQVSSKARPQEQHNVLEIRPRAQGLAASGRTGGLAGPF